MTKTLLPIGNAKYITKMNKIRILNLIRDGKATTRVEVSKISGLSAPTVTRLVDSLISRDQLISETGTTVSSGGRRPTLLKFTGIDNFVIGIDLGATNIYGILANLNAEIIAEIKNPTFKERGSKDVLERTAELINELKNHPAVVGKRILGMGMAVAGLISQDRNIVEFSPDLHWYDVDIKAALDKPCGLAIHLDKVTRMMAMGELLYGIGNQYKNFVCVNVGHGIGAGIIFDGKPLYGFNGMAGEFGHIALDKYSDVQCDCGNYGCLETTSSGQAIARNARAGLERGIASILIKMCNGDYSNITAEMVAEAAKTGDIFASNIFNSAAQYLGIGIADLINLLAPEAIVIGGGVAQAGDILFETVRKTVAAKTISMISRDVVIRPATFGIKAAAMGAISVILDDVLHLKAIE